MPQHAKIFELVCSENISFPLGKSLPPKRKRKNFTGCNSVRLTSNKERDWK